MSHRGRPGYPAGVIVCARASLPCMQASQILPLALQICLVGLPTFCIKKIRVIEPLSV